MPENTAPSFTAPGTGFVLTRFADVETLKSVTVLADGRIVVAGSLWDGHQWDLMVARYQTDGALDAGFHGDGYLTTAFGQGYDTQGQALALQSDGKWVVGGFSNYIDYSMSEWSDKPTGYRFAVARYYADGGIDTGFNGDGLEQYFTQFGREAGKYAHFINRNDQATSVLPQSDGKLVLAGYSQDANGNSDFAVTRLNADGTLDDTFAADSGNNTALTDLGSDADFAHAATLQADGKIILAGSTWNGDNTDVALVRYNTDGTLDADFADGGKAIADWGGDDSIYAVAVNGDQILAAGKSWNGSDYDMALFRYNSNGSLDTGFADGGRLLTDFGGDDWANALAVQAADGKLVLAGASAGRFALARYNADGSLDKQFGDHGKVITDLTAGNDEAYAVSIQADGKIVVTGNTGDGHAALVRYLANGSLDTQFGAANSVDTQVDYTVGGEAVVLADHARVYDAELAAQHNYAGATVQLQRHGGANSNDVFVATGPLSFSGDTVLVAGIAIGQVSQSNGVLNIVFNAQATQGRVNKALSSLAYQHLGGEDTASMQIDWTFSDGNSGDALTAVGSTTVHFTQAPANSAPSFTSAGDGKMAATSFFINEDIGRAITVQTNGSLLLAGYSGNDVALNRYLANGSLDTSFAGDGKATAAIGSFQGVGYAMAVQKDGKIVVAGSADNGDYSNSDTNFALLRFNGDGGLDTSFSGNGKTTTDFHSTADVARAVAVQPDGKILVAGYTYNAQTYYDFALARYLDDGSLDTSFSGNGKLHADFAGGAGSWEAAYAMGLQADGKIVLAGFYWNGYNFDFGLARYQSNGEWDKQFGYHGKAATDFSGDYDAGYALAFQNDGKILVAGESRSNTGGSDFALARYNSDGSLDASFSGDGKAVADFYGEDRGRALALQKDGKIIVAGYTDDGSFLNIAVARFNADGSLDAGFGDGGKVITRDIAHSDFNYIAGVALAVTVQDDGKIVVGGYSDNGGKYNFALVRYNPDGSLDNHFDAHNTLDGNARYLINGPAVVLDGSVQIFDTELGAVDNYNGASITLMRHGGANADDQFGAAKHLKFIGNQALLSGIVIGTVDNQDGVLTLTFNSHATQARVDAALSSLAYQNTAASAPETIAIDWLFNDGNQGAQGSGGATTAAGSTTVTIAAQADNTAPYFQTHTQGSNFVAIGTASEDRFTAVQVQANGKILAAGYTDNGTENYDIALMRFKTNGGIDKSFGDGGKVITDFGDGAIFQSDLALLAHGKILVAGAQEDKFVLARYLRDGSLDTRFSGDGKVATAFDNTGDAVKVLALPDGGILLAGSSGGDFGLIRYRANGSIDTSFGVNGKVTTDLGSEGDMPEAVFRQADGKIIVAGVASQGSDLEYFMAGGETSSIYGDFAIARYNADGSLDASFGNGGKTVTDVAGLWNVCSAVTELADGRIIVAGGIHPSSGNNQFALVAYDADGNLDSRFGINGKVTTGFAGRALINNIMELADGKLLAAGSGDGNFYLARYNADGSLDDGFGKQGTVTLANGTYGYAATLQADGKILIVGGYSSAAIMRLNADGSPDTGFGWTDGLANRTHYTQNGDAVVLNSHAAVHDQELDTQGHYAGASVTLMRHGGANADDVFSASGKLAFVGDQAILAGHGIGTVSNADGVLSIVFNDQATTARVNAALAAITYRNLASEPPARVRIDWQFDDGNHGGQGDGGALAATGKTSVIIKPGAGQTFLLDGMGGTSSQLTDFDPAHDTIQLDQNVFSHLSAIDNGALDPSQFVIGAAALDHDDYLIYQRDSGWLYYDADGNGANAQTPIAFVGVNLDLNANTFVLVNGA